MSIEQNDQETGDRNAALETKPVAKTKPKVNTSKSGSNAHIIKITLDVSKSQPQTLGVLAAVSGASDNTVFAVALSLVSNYERSKKVLSTTNEIASADPMESGVLAVMCATEDAGLFRLVWALTKELTATLPAAAPASKTKAGIDLAKELQSLSGEAKSTLEKARKVVS